jgi:hypothetical protein
MTADWKRLHYEIRPHKNSKIITHKKQQNTKETTKYTRKAATKSLTIAATKEEDSLCDEFASHVTAREFHALANEDHMPALWQKIGALRGTAEAERP